MSAGAGESALLPAFLPCYAVSVLRITYDRVHGICIVLAQEESEAPVTYSAHGRSRIFPAPAVALMNGFTQRRVRPTWPATCAHSLGSENNHCFRQLACPLYYGHPAGLLLLELYEVQITKIHGLSNRTPSKRGWLYFSIWHHKFCWSLAKLIKSLQICTKFQSNKNQNFVRA